MTDEDKPDLEIGSHDEGPAARIKKLWEGLKISARTSAQTAWQIGEILEQQTLLLKYGDWERWFRSSQFEFDIRTARRYRKLYRDWPDGADNLSGVTEGYLRLPDLDEEATTAKIFPLPPPEAAAKPVRQGRPPSNQRL
jgi:hypothetical protein